VRLSLAVCLVAGCGRVAFDEAAGDSGRTADAAPCTEAWSAPVKVPIDILDAREPSISDDDLDLYFSSGSPGDIYVVTRPSPTSAWSPAMMLASPPNSAEEEVSPSIAAGGLDLYMTATRGGNAVIVRSHRATKTSPWGPLSGGLGATGSGDISADQLTMVAQDFMSPVRFYRRAAVTDQLAFDFDAPAIVNDGSVNTSPSLSADGLDLYFRSDRSGSPAIWVAHRASVTSAFTTVERIEMPFDTGAPDISADGHHLYMHREVVGFTFEVWVASRCE
jgi:hypothetical protein